jgi:large subunit ribosomal protein L23
MGKQILIRPVVTEKSTKLTSRDNQYAFVVHENANKLEIKTAVEFQFSVKVLSVNTMRVAKKVKNSFRNGKQISGFKPGYKKAIVSLQEGEYINLYETEGEEVAAAEN